MKCGKNVIANTGMKKLSYEKAFIFLWYHDDVDDDDVIRVLLQNYWNE